MNKSVTPLFNKVAVFTDIHLGLKNNSKDHNEDCVEYIEWFCKLAKENDAETCIFMGDFHHNRNTINILTLNYSYKVLKLLNDNFNKVYFIIGNHDLFYREKRDLHSIVAAYPLEKIELIDNPIVKGDVCLSPWLVGDEWKKVIKSKCRYMFGHFEIPSFKMNAMVEMPDTGTIKLDDFKNQEYVFSGHFHKRQQNKNVHYIGNPFGHNYSDIWDFDRGCMLLKWGGAPEYFNYEAGPRYITADLSDILDDPDHYLKPKTHAKVNLNLTLSYEEVNFLKETLLETYKIREFKLIQESEQEHKDELNVDLHFETVDQIVTDGLKNIDSVNFDKTKLIDIYNNLGN